MVRGAEDAPWKHNYILITFNSDDRPDRERQLLSALRTRRVDGILLVAATTEGDLSHIQCVIESGIPIVALDRVLKTLPVDSLTVDNTAGADDCVRHLIDCGHRRIGIITGPPHLPVARDRLEGYKRALANAGLPFDEQLVRDGGFRAEGGYTAAMELLREAHPTAIFTSNATMALGLLRALNELELESPRDVALATFDDPPFAEAVRPQLTSVAQPSYDLGYKGTELLLRRINDPTRKRVSQVLKTELKVRSSTVASHAATL
jgi:LacI family transcriptional regulator